MDTQQTIRQQLSAWLDGELEPQETSRLQELLKTDPQVASELEGLRKVRQLVAGLPHVKAPQGLSQRIMAQARAAQSIRRVQPVRARTISLVWGRLAAAAAVVVTVGVGIGVGLNLRQWTGSQTQNTPVAVNAAQDRGSPAIARDINGKEEQKSGVSMTKTGQTELARNSENENAELLKEQLEKGKTASEGKTDDFANKDKQAGSYRAEPRRDAANSKAPGSTEYSQLPANERRLRQDQPELADLAEDLRERDLRPAKTERKLAKNQDVEELACLSANAAQQDVEKLLRKNGIEFKAAADAGWVAENDRNKKAATDTIIYQVSMTQDQYDKVRKGLDQIRDNQALAMSGRKDGSFGANVLNSGKKRDAVDKNSGATGGFVKKLDESTVKAAPPAPAVAPIQSDTPAERVKPQDVKQAQVAIADANRHEQPQQQRSPGGADEQFIAGNQVGGGGAGAGRPGSTEADDKIVSPPQAASDAAAAPATMPAGQSAASQPAGLWTALAARFLGRQTAQRGQQAKQDQDGKRTMTIVLKIVQNPPEKQADNAARPPADNENAPAQNK
ncbi:MAG: hypothetical protein HZA50_06640 [Planctomycetes bacterium]|nr:hypothetical protein [Planctomycetota bacterium]